MTCSVFSKRPDDRLDFDVDFRRDRWLPTGDEIIAATVTVDAESGVVVDAYEFTATIVKVWLSAGTLDKTATVTVDVVTQQQREKEVTFRVRIEEKC